MFSLSLIQTSHLDHKSSMSRLLANFISLPMKPFLDKKNKVAGLLLFNSLLITTGVCPISSMILCSWFKCSTEFNFTSPACPKISKDESTYKNLFNSDFEEKVKWSDKLKDVISSFLIGGIWYAIFKNAWMSANNFSEADLNNRNMPKVFLLSFLFSLIMSINLALFIGKEDLMFGTIAGFMTGFGWIAFAIGIIALFENKSMKYVLINGGYMIVAFTVMGLILGAWK